MIKELYNFIDDINKITGEKCNISIGINANQVLIIRITWFKNLQQFGMSQALTPLEIFTTNHEIDFVFQLIKNAIQEKVSQIK